MELYQLGSFGYDEGKIEPSIILEHEKDFSEKEIYDMQDEVKKELKGFPSAQAIADFLCAKYDFKIRKTKIFNRYDMYGL